jgi:mannose-6-phosphate isomerase-like protein (cupin superfamily)
MTTPTASAPQERRRVTLARRAAAGANDIATRYARLQHTLIAWSAIPESGGTLHQDAAHELVVALVDTSAILHVGEEQVGAPRRSIGILPPGPSTIVASGPGTVVRFFTPLPPAFAAPVVNGGDYVAPRAVRPLGEPLRRIGPPAPRVHRMPRLRPEQAGTQRVVEAETMSVMWIENHGPQDLAKVGPHAHADFEEGALVLEGAYVLHLRTPWGSDARRWRDDEHLACEPGALVIVPPTVTHVAEAIGEGDHTLLNVFAPPRRDHRDKGIVINAAEYAFPES